jgi:3-methylcrotonyl-CoA carboxylase alpha subunit
VRRLRKLLIANRGEIACRIARTARRLGLELAGVHSVADRGARHVRELGESVELRGEGPGAGYLDVDAIVAAARRVGADAVHPGYGFLSEQPSFVRAVEAAGLSFVGPSAETMERLGGKASARAEAARAGVPVLEGSDEGSIDVARIAARVRGAALPVALKAVHGGGGRGMAIVEDLLDLEARIAGAMREAAKAFGDGALIVERFLPRVRHVEVQIAGDGQGQAIHLFERECTLQRRHQKIVEEAPAAPLPPGLRERMLQDACRLARAVGYRGLGTVEFIVHGERHHFIEVNPRLQVEHPVTEAVTGLDLVELQLAIADAGRLPISQHEVRCDGHAVEVRLCAEDAATGWLPATGTVLRARLPGPPVRVESAVEDGDAVTPHYDSMIAKLIVAGDTRDAALDAMREALQRTSIAGVPTNLGLLEALVDLPETRSGAFHTRLIDERFVAAAPLPQAGRAPLPAAIGCAAALAWLARSRRAAPPLGVWSEPGALLGWRVPAGPPAPSGAAAALLRAEGVECEVRFSPAAADGSMRVALGGEVHACALHALGGERWLLGHDGVTHRLSIVAEGDAFEFDGPLGRHRVEVVPWVGGAAAAAPDGGVLVAPMMGKVTAIEAAVGDPVSAGRVVVVLESMKMELRVGAPFDAVLASLRCAVGDSVERGQVLGEVRAQADAHASGKGER